MHRNRGACRHDLLVGGIVLDERDVVSAASVRDERIVVLRRIVHLDARRRRVHKSVRGRVHHDRDALDAAQGGLHFLQGERSDSGVPPGLCGADCLADVLQRLPLCGGQRVDLQIARAGLLGHHLADERHAVGLRRVGVDVEAVGDVRRKAREVVLAALQLACAGRPDGEGVFVREVALDRERRGLRDGRVDERRDRVRAVRAVVARHGIDDGHRERVPDLGKPGVSSRERLPDAHRRYLVVLRPDGAPLPGFRGTVQHVVLGRGVDSKARKPADERAGRGLFLQRREPEAFLDRIVVELPRRAVAARPHPVVAVAVDDVCVGFHGLLEAEVLRVVVAVDVVERMRPRQEVPHRDVARERRVHLVGELDVERLHRALPAVVVLDEHKRLGGLGAV